MLIFLVAGPQPTVGEYIMSIQPHARVATDVPSACALGISVMASAYRVARCDLAAPLRSAARTARARQAAIYLAHVAFGLSVSAVAEAFGRDRSTVRHACRRIEDARDDQRVDLGLAYLEVASQGLMRSVADQARQSSPLKRVRG